MIRKLRNGKIFLKVKNESDGKLLLDSFLGISPRRFLHIFRHPKGRKTDKLNLKLAERTESSPYLECRFVIDYFAREISVLHHAKNSEYIKKINKIEKIFKFIPEYSKINKCVKKFREWSDAYWKYVVK